MGFINSDITTFNKNFGIEITQKVRRSEGDS